MTVEEKCSNFCAKIPINWGVGGGVAWGVGGRSPFTLRECIQQALHCSGLSLGARVQAKTAVGSGWL